MPSPTPITKISAEKLVPVATSVIPECRKYIHVPYLIIKAFLVN